MCRANRRVVLGLYRSGPNRNLLEQALRHGVRAIDTAYNYQRFNGHRALYAVGSDLLDQFTVSTKLGFFPDGRVNRGAVHSLDPAKLREAAERSADELGRVPDTVLLHNPEQSLAALPGQLAHTRLRDACAALRDVVSARFSRSWGIASWDPRTVVTALRHTPRRIEPDVVLMRAGLSVAHPILTAAEELCWLLDIVPEHRWGMSPFGGSFNDPAWHTANLNVFLQDHQHGSNAQTAFRLAYDLPEVARVAVGTTSNQHLRDVVTATDLAINEEAIARYRYLIKQSH